ncbi:hypothetical protein RB213_002462 [Colletotrichum asianum]
MASLLLRLSIASGSHAEQLWVPFRAWQAGPSLCEATIGRANEGDSESGSVLKNQVPFPAPCWLLSRHPYLAKICDNCSE